MKWNAKIAVTCLLIICLGAIALVAARSDGSKPTSTYSQFIEKVEAGQVASVVVRVGKSGASPASYLLKDGRAERTVLPTHYQDAIRAMQEARVNIEIEDTSSSWRSMLMNASPFLLLLGVWVFMMLRIRKRPEGFGEAVDSLRGAH
jgi:ATP-dependent Zn protease